MFDGFVPLDCPFRLDIVQDALRKNLERQVKDAGTVLAAGDGLFARNQLIGGANAALLESDHLTSFQN